MDKFYENFFFIVDGQEHYTFEIQEEYENRNGDISKFRGTIRCPECRRAEFQIPLLGHLDFTYGKTPEIKLERREAVFYRWNKEIKVFQARLYL